MRLLVQFPCDSLLSHLRREAQERQATVFRETTVRSLILRLTVTGNDGGVVDEACTMFTEIYNWFTEGFDTADLLQAKPCSTRTEDNPPTLDRQSPKTSPICRHFSG